MYTTRFIDILLFKPTPKGLCLSCLSAFEKIAETHCPTCFKNSESTICSDCLYWKRKEIDIDHTSLYTYNKQMSLYFRQFKFQGDYLLRIVFAKEIKKALAGHRDYIVVPIPLSKENLAIRGFNQVEAMLDAAGIHYENLLDKIETKKQSSKNRLERLKLEQPFSIKEGKNIPSKIILVDDIYTTGATLQHATRLFMKMGAKEVKTFSLAR